MKVQETGSEFINQLPVFQYGKGMCMRILIVWGTKGSKAGTRVILPFNSTIIYKINITDSAVRNYTNRVLYKII
jgi:hypothetical protein